MIKIGRIDHHGYTSQFVRYKRHQNKQKSFAEQEGILKNPGDVILSVGEESMKGKSFTTVIEAIDRAKSVLELTLGVRRSPAKLPENNNNNLPSEFHWIQIGQKYYVVDGSGSTEHGAEVTSLPYYSENNWVVDIKWVTAPERKNQKVLCSKVTRYLFNAHQRPVRARNIPKRFIDQKFVHIRRNTSKLKTSVENSRNSQGNKNVSSDGGNDICERQAIVQKKQRDMHKETSTKKRKVDSIITKENNMKSDGGNDICERQAIVQKKQMDMHKETSTKKRKVGSIITKENNVKSDGGNEICERQAIVQKKQMDMHKETSTKKRKVGSIIMKENSVKSDGGNDICERQAVVQNKQMDMHKETSTKKRKVDSIIMKENNVKSDGGNDICERQAIVQKKQRDMHKETSTKKRKVGSIIMKENNVKRDGGNDICERQAIVQKKQRDMHKETSTKKRKVGSIITKESIVKSDGGNDICERQAIVQKKQTDMHEETSTERSMVDSIIKKENKGDEGDFRCSLNGSRRGCVSSSNKVKLPCNHEFCRPCLYKILNSAKDVITYELIGRPDEKFSIIVSCPDCRQKFSPRTISRLLEEDKAQSVDHFN
jgi:hypothetical protein